MINMPTALKFWRILIMLKQPAAVFLGHADRPRPAAIRISFCCGAKKTGIMITSQPTLWAEQAASCFEKPCLCALYGKGNIMKNDIDDLLNSVFGSRTLRTGGQAAGREKPETPRLTLEPEPKQPSPRGRSPQRRTAPGRPAAPPAAPRGRTRAPRRTYQSLTLTPSESSPRDRSPRRAGLCRHRTPGCKRRAGAAGFGARGSTHGRGAGRGPSRASERRSRP